MTTAKAKKGPKQLEGEEGRTERLPSLRITPAEKAAFAREAAAAGRTVSLEIRWRLFGGGRA